MSEAHPTNNHNETLPNSTRQVVAAPFLGSPVEICIVTPDIRRTIGSLLELGLGPFKLFTFSPATCSSQTYYGEPVEFEMRVAFASPPAGSGSKIIWELMEPVSGPTIMKDFLERNPDGGIQHVAFDSVQRRETTDRSEGEVLRALTVGERKEEFRRRGYDVVMTGIWHGSRGTCEFTFFDTFDKDKGGIGTCFESYEFSPDWEEPEGTWIGIRACECETGC